MIHKLNGIIQELKDNYLELYSEMDLLVHLSGKIQMDLRIEEFVNQILMIIKNRVDFEGANIVLLDPEKKVLKTFRLSPSLYDDPARYERVKELFNKELPLDPKIWLCRVAMQQSEVYYPEFTPEILEKLTQEERARVLSLGYTGCYMLPLILGEKSIGALLVYNTKYPLFLTDAERNSIRRLAVVVSRAIETTRLYHEIKFQNESMANHEAEMSQKNQWIQERTQELEQELEQSSRLNEVLLPKTSFPLFCQRAQEPGGDFLFLREINDRIYLVLAEFSEKNPLAVLKAAYLKEFLSSSQIFENFSELPQKILQTQNQEKFSFLCAEFDLKNFCLTHFSHRSSFPCLFRKNQPFQAIFSQTTSLLPGDRILIGTQGFLKEKNLNEQSFETVIYPWLSENQTLPSNLWFQEIQKKFQEHLISRIQEKDALALMIEIH